MMADPVPTKPDNYFAPENSTFYKSGSYQPLSSEEFRLLQLLPGSGNSALHCKLLQNIPLASPPPYEAISYCAGDPRKTIVIQIDGLQFNAFETVGRALYHVRLETSERIIWTDQICINMSHSDERSRQVAKMRNIYESAVRVLMWTGIERAPMSISSTFPFAAMMKHGHTELQEHISQLVGPNDRLSEVDIVIANREILRQSYVDFWREFRSVFASPYWTRAWICQEMIVPKDLFILGRDEGSKVLSWDVILKALEVFRITSALSLKIRRRENYAGLTENEYLLLKDCQEEFQNGFLGNSIVANLLWIIDIRQAWQAKRIPGMKGLLNHSRSCNVTDPRDRIYAFLGLADPGYAIVPDYTTKTTEEKVFIQMATQIILHEKKLEILQDSEGLAGGLRQCPSWVPNWSSRFERQIVNPVVSFKASGDTDANVTFKSLDSGTGWILCTEGFIIDRIAEDDQRLLSANEDFSYQKDRAAIERFLDPTEQSVASMSMFTRLYKYLRGTWANNWAYFTGRRNVQVIEDRHSAAKLLAYSACLGLESPMHKSDPSKMEDNVEKILQWGGLTKNPLFFHSPKGYIGQVYRGARATDVLCIFPGASVPFLLKKEGDHYLLVSAAYIHGMMHGEVMEVLRKRKIQLETIEIH